MDDYGFWIGQPLVYHVPTFEVEGRAQKVLLLFESHPEIISDKI